MRRLLALSLFAAAALALHVAPAGAEEPRRFVVYFQEWSAAFDDAALGTISHAADYAKQHPEAHVTVAGFADPTGSREANVLMSQLRARVVTDQLLTDGVPGPRIAESGKGEVQFALSSQESRRVEIAVGAP